MLEIKSEAHWGDQGGLGGPTMVSFEKPGHLRLLADKDDPLLRGAPRWADRGDVSVRGGRRSLDEAFPKWSEISGNLDKSSKTTYDCGGREIQRGGVIGVAAVEGDALAGGEQGGMPLASRCVNFGVFRFNVPTRHLLRRRNQVRAVPI